MSLHTLRNLVVAAAASATLLAGLLPLPWSLAGPSGAMAAAPDRHDGSREDDSGIGPAQDTRVGGCCRLNLDSEVTVVSNQPSRLRR